MKDERFERIAHQIALEICEATAIQEQQWAWPADFVGDVIDRARSRAEKVLEIADEPDPRDWRERFDPLSPYFRG